VISAIDTERRIGIPLALDVGMMTRPLAETAIVEDFWGDLNRDILECLAKGPVSPGEIGRRLGISEAAAASCLSLLASEGRVRICLVEKGAASV
jgi:hypothetical protein